MKSCFPRAGSVVGCESIASVDRAGCKLKTVTAARIHFLVLISSFVLSSAGAATWYVDSTATGSHTGTSWANAWTSLNQISGISAGDTVYISGGRSGSSQDYPVSIYSGYPGRWIPAGGTASAPVTYQVGQDSAHNGTVVFDGLGGDVWLVGAVNNVIISGDAGDGQMHFALTNYVSEAINNEGFSFGSGVRITYVNFGNLPAAIDLNPGPAGPLEIDHTYTYIGSMTADHWGFFSSVQGTTWDAIRIHDNTVYVPRASSNSGYGTDGMQISGTGFSIYNNILYAYSANYTGSQHQDGIQMLGMNYVKIYGNVINNMNNSSIFGDNFSSPSHVRIYNNVTTGGGGGVEMGNDASASGQTWVFNDIVVANNTDDSTSQGIGIGSHFAAVFTNTIVANNVMINCSQITTGYSGQSVDNVTLNSAQAASVFLNYAAGNYHLTSAATSLIGQGMNLSTYFATDKDGLTRSPAGAWDIGAYVYGAATNTPVIRVTPGSIAFGSILSGTAVTNSFTVQNIGGGTLTGSASAPAPFSIVSGGNYSLGSNQSQTVMVSFNPSNAGNYNQNVTFTGGGGASAGISGSATNSVGPGVTPPSAPASLVASPVSPSEIDLSWAASTAGTYAIAGYRIYVNGASVPTATVATTSYKSTGLLANTTNSYIVTAYDTATNESSPANITAVTWPPLSTKFSLNQQVQILATANIRQQPTNGLVGAVIGTQPAGAVGTVVGGPVYAAINGVYYYWWNLSFSSSPSGWVAEDNLQTYSAVPLMQVSPASVAFGSILSGTSITGSFTVKNIGGGTLSGAVSVALPFTILSGGSYNLTSNQSQTVTVLFSPITAGSYNQNATLTGGGGAAVSLTAAATNAPVVIPTVSAISMNVTDVDLNLSGLQIYSGTTVQFSATATNMQTWQWNYSVNGGSPVVYRSGSGPVTNISFYFGTNTIGNSYLWSLAVSNGQAGAVSSTNLAVEAVPPAGTIITNIIQGPVVSATSGTLKGLMTATTTISNVPTTYFYQPLPSIGNTSGGTATYNVTVTNAGNYEIQALVYAPNINANSFLVNVDGQPQNPNMIWDIMPVTSGFEQRLVCWRGATGSENNDSIVPVVFNLSAGTHQIVFVGREPGTGMASFSLQQIVTTVQSPSPPAAPTGLRIISSAF